MKEVTVDYVLKMDGKVLNGKWPLSPPQPGLLTKAQIKAVNKLIKDEIADAKRHFKDGAWNLNGGSIADEVLYRIFGTHIEDYIVCRTAKECKVAAEWSSKGSLLKNERPKVFYRPRGNRLYVDTKARNVNVDKQIGDL